MDRRRAFVATSWAARFTGAAVRATPMWASASGQATSKCASTDRRQAPRPHAHPGAHGFVESRRLLLAHVHQLHALEFLAIRAGVEELVHFLVRTVVARGHAGLLRLAGDRVYVFARVGADTLVVALALAHHHARAHVVVPSAPKGLGNVVVARQPVTFERHPHEARTGDLLRENATAQHHRALGGAGRFHRRCARSLPELAGERPRARLARQPLMLLAWRGGLH